MFKEKLKFIFVLCSHVICTEFINIDIDDEQTEQVKEPEPFHLDLPFR